MRVVVRMGGLTCALTMMLGCTSLGPLGSTSESAAAPCEQVAPVRHDLLILFTDEAISRHGVRSLQTNSLASVDWTNQAYRNSCVNLQVRVIGTLRSPMQEAGTGIVDTQLALRTNPDVAALRDQLYADLVLLISEDAGDGWTGVGSFFYTYDSGILKAVDSFAVVKAPALNGETVAHELGHMQGLDHNRENASEPAPGKYHYGFRVCARGGFRDIMSFGCPNGTLVPVIQQYSNPRLTYNGYRTGVNPEEDAANAADAARGLDDMAVFIATYREPPMPATAPAGETDGVRATEHQNASRDSAGIDDPKEQGRARRDQPQLLPDR